MNQQKLPQIFVSAIEPLQEKDLDELFSALDERGLLRRFEQRESVPYASLELLIPTAVIIAVTHSYFDGIIKEIGKENYQWFKNAVSSLYKKLLGGRPEFAFDTIRSGKPKKSPHFSGSLSFFYASPRGFKVKLLFPMDVTEDDYAKSCEEFVKLLAEHTRSAEEDAVIIEVARQALEKSEGIGDEIPLNQVIPTITLLVFWDRHSNKFRVVDPIESGRSGVLSSRILGGE